jgi:hypothetical protein
VSTASKRSIEKPEAWSGRRINFAEFSRELFRRRAELGDIEVPRNSGTRRTESKRALLKAIEDAGGKW